MKNTSLDDIAAYLPKMEFNRKKPQLDKTYCQKMQSLNCARRFILKTTTKDNEHLQISLLDISSEKTIGKRSAIKSEPETIQKAVKSLERKAKCKLYYVLLISTDGEYL